MTEFANAWEIVILQHNFGRASYDPPATYYVAALTAVPSDGGFGNEVATGGYARAIIGNTQATHWSPPTVVAASGTMVFNVASFAFPAAQNPWPSIAAIGLFPVTSGGSLLAWTPVTPVQVASGQTPRFNPGDFRVWLD